MYDVIEGSIKNVIDGDTFEMDITHIGRHNQYSYNDLERIRIADIDAPEINTREGKISKQSLTKKLNRKRVIVSVRSRDKYGRVIGEIEKVYR